MFGHRKMPRIQIGQNRNLLLLEDLQFLLHLSLLLLTIQPLNILCITHEWLVLTVTHGPKVVIANGFSILFGSILFLNQLQSLAANLHFLQLFIGEQHFKVAHSMSHLILSNCFDFGILVKALHLLLVLDYLLAGA
jgi:hypothetical protein